MKKKTTFVLIVCTLLLIACSPLTDSSSQARKRPLVYEQILINCQLKCDEVAASIQAGGGSVDNAYKNISALAATVPNNQIKALSSVIGRHNVSKDIQIKISPPNELRTNHPISYTLQRTAKAHASTLGSEYNFPLIGARSLHESGNNGEGIIVAVIDSGTANNPEVVPSLAGSVIGGENFVAADGEPSATSTLNDDHGTWVASLIAGHTAIELPNDDSLVASLQEHSPDSVIPIDDTHSEVPLVGTAPAASIYALKTFAAGVDGTSRSVVLDAMDRALTLKHNFNQGIPSEPVAGDGSEDHPFVYDSLNIQVVNMSLGGPTLFPGYEFEDELALKMLREGMLVVAAAGNEGPAAMTAGSPATSFGALSVGAVNSAVNERVIRDVKLGAGSGIVFRPTDYVQTAYFSSRGPNADGRNGPMVMANGFAAFVQGANGDLGFKSGTSFSTPTVAGAAATLFFVVPESDAAQIRQALIDSADNTIVGDHSDRYDQGHGVVNMPAALALLHNGIAAPIPELPVLSSPKAVEDMLDVTLFDRNIEQQRFSLIAGETRQFFIKTDLDTGTIMVDIEDVHAQLPAEQQNTFFGDDVIVTVLDAPTSINDIIFDDFVVDPTLIPVVLPQTGLIRIAVTGDWTNAGPVDVVLSARGKSRREPREVLQGKLQDAETHDALMQVVPGTTSIDLELSWEGGWNSFPAHDLDVYLLDPDGALNFDGASLSAPERVHIDNPIPGFWTLFIDGYEVHGFRDEYELSVVDQDGRQLKVR